MLYFVHLPRHQADAQAHALEGLNAIVQTVTHARDLGAHLSVGARSVAPTLTKRMYQATRTIRTIGNLRTTTKKKSH